MSSRARHFRPYRELMDGSDGRLSFTKHVIVAILVLFAAGDPLPAWLTIVLILSSKSVHLLYSWLIKTAPRA